METLGKSQTQKQPGSTKLSHLAAEAAQGFLVKRVSSKGFRVKGLGLGFRDYFLADF